MKAFLAASATLLAVAPIAAAAQTTQGFAREGLARIGTVMKDDVAAGRFPGAVTLIARNGRIVHLETHGFQDAAKTKPMRRDTIFRMASMTKPITTVAAMMLVEQGKLRLEDAVGTHLPELKDLKVELRRKGDGGAETSEDVSANPITVQDLMRHTSGLVYSFSSPSPRVKKAYDDAKFELSAEDMPPAEMLKRLAQIPLVVQPGTEFNYSVSTDVLGLLVERVAKKPLDQVLQEMLLGPLGMKDTAFWVPEAKRARLAELLDGDPLKASANRMCLPEADIRRNYFQGGAGLCSTIDDYYRFVQMLANGGEFGGRRYLSPKTVAFMLSDHTLGMTGTTAGSTGPGYGFGLGFAVRRHDGMGWAPGSVGDAMWAGIFGTSFTIDPREKLLAIQLTQGAAARLRSRIMFKSLVYGAMGR